MGLYSVSIFLVTVTSLVIIVGAPTQQLTKVASFGANAAGGLVNNINPETWYSIRNVILMHNGCKRWCWIQTRKLVKEDCYKVKQERCKQLEKFSYKAFIIYQLSKFGMAKLASTVLNAPVAIVGAGFQAGSTVVTSVGNGVVAVGSGVGKGAAAVTSELGKGGVAVAQGTSKVVAGGAQFAGDATMKTAAIVGDSAKAVGGGAVDIGQKAVVGGAQFAGDATMKTAAIVGDSAKALGSGALNVGQKGVEGLGAGTQALVGGMGKMVSSPSRLFGSKNSGSK